MSECLTTALQYACRRCGAEFLAAADWIDGEWVLETGEAERCPRCGEWGRCLEHEDPDAFWDAEHRALQDDN